MNFKYFICLILTLNLGRIKSSPLVWEDYDELTAGSADGSFDFPEILFAEVLEEIFSSGGENNDADEYGEYFEGDMILNEFQERALNGQSPGRTGRINEIYRWNTTIGYELDPGFSTRQMAQIISAMADIEEVTCLTFRPKSDDDLDFIFFNSDATGCSSSVGRQGGWQRINLKPNYPGSGCFKSGSIIHEIIHALGFYHMQSASDRDQYVQIVWENITPGKEHNFRYYDDSLITHFGFPYDYNSIMHYSATAFSVNGNYTIVPLESNEIEMGQRVTMTEFDVGRINKMYCNL